MKKIFLMALLIAGRETAALDLKTAMALRSGMNRQFDGIKKEKKAKEWAVTIGAGAAGATLTAVVIHQTYKTAAVNRRYRRLGAPNMGMLNPSGCLLGLLAGAAAGLTSYLLVRSKNYFSEITGP